MRYGGGEGGPSVGVLAPPAPVEAAEPLALAAELADLDADVVDVLMRPRPTPRALPINHSMFVVVVVVNAEGGG